MKVIIFLSFGKILESPKMLFNKKGDRRRVYNSYFLSEISIPPGVENFSKRKVANDVGLYSLNSQDAEELLVGLK